MHKGWIVAPALLALTMAGCNKEPEAPSPPRFAGAQVKGIYAFGPCLPAAIPPENKVVGTINIVLPDKLNGAKLSRVVNYGPTMAPNDSKTGEGTPGFKRNAQNAKEPLDLFMNHTSYPTSGYVRVRALIRNEDKWHFLATGDFNGVGTNDPNDDVMCGITKIQNLTGGPGNARRAAIFYIDLAKLAAKPRGYAAPFTIGLETGPENPTTDEKLIRTPILIDPKVRNDGGGR